MIPKFAYPLLACAGFYAAIFLLLWATDNPRTNEVFPEAVTTDAKGMKSVDYPALVVPLIESVKTLKAANDNLVSATLKLRADNDNLAREVQDLKRAVNAMRR